MYHLLTKEQQIARRLEHWKATQQTELKAIRFEVEQLSADAGDYVIHAYDRFDREVNALSVKNLVI